MSDKFKMQCHKLTWRDVLKIVLVLIVLTSLTSCWGLPGLTATGGVGVGTPLSPEEQEQVNTQKEAEQQAQTQSEQSAQNIADMRNQAINALDNAMQTFIHDSAGPLTEEARQMMRDIFDLKESLSNMTDGAEIWNGYHQAQSLLFDAYPVAVSIGAVQPTVVGQRGWQETWWFISSP